MIQLRKRVDVLIFTPKEEEFLVLDSLLRKGIDWQDPVSKLAYRLGSLKGKAGSVRVGILCSGKGILKTPPAVREAIESLRPCLVILFGTAAGLKEATIGDILVGDEGRYYEQGKITKKGFNGNPLTQQASLRQVERARMLKRNTSGWYRYLPKDGSSPPDVYVGAIVSGDKVLATKHAELNELLQQQHAEAIGLEMEAYPFLNTALSRPGVEAIIIRGVSDLMGDKTEQNRNGSKNFALVRAAAFLRYYLEEENLLATSSKFRYWPWAMGLVFMLGLTLLLNHFFAPAIAHSTPDFSEDSTRISTPASSSAHEAENSTNSELIASKRVPEPLSPKEPSSPTKNIPDDSLQEIPPEVVPEDPLIKEGSNEVIAKAIIPPLEKHLFRFSIYAERGKKIKLDYFNIDGDTIRAEKTNFIKLPIGSYTLYLNNNEKSYKIPFEVTPNRDSNGIKYNLYD